MIKPSSIGQIKKKRPPEIKEFRGHNSYSNTAGAFGLGPGLRRVSCRPRLFSRGAV